MLNSVSLACGGGYRHPCIVALYWLAVRTGPRPLDDGGAEKIDHGLALPARAELRPQTTGGSGVDKSFELPEAGKGVAA